MINVSKDVLETKMLEYQAVPLRTKQTAEEAFGDVRGKAKLVGDLTEPTTDEWPEVLPAPHHCRPDDQVTLSQRTCNPLTGDEPLSDCTGV
jgi:hypothetical protein